MAGDSAPIYFAATYWLAKETPPTNKARNIFFGSDLSLESVRKSRTSGIRNIKTDNCNTTFVLRCNTSKFVSLAAFEQAAKLGNEAALANLKQLQQILSVKMK